MSWLSLSFFTRVVLVGTLLMQKDTIVPPMAACSVKLRGARCASFSSQRAHCTEDSATVMTSNLDMSFCSFALLCLCSTHTAGPKIMCNSLTCVLTIWVGSGELRQAPRVLSAAFYLCELMSSV